MKNSIALLLVGAGLVLGAFVGFVFGFERGKFQAGLEENKLAKLLLWDHSEIEISDDLREYLKGRVYYNLASKFPNDRGYLLRRDWDFGPVDNSVFGTNALRRPYAKDPFFDAESFDGATAQLSQAEQFD